MKALIALSARARSGWTFGFAPLSAIWQRTLAVSENECHTYVLNTRPLA